MYHLINRHIDDVVKALDAIGDIREYIELRRQLTSDPGAALRPDFQRAYRKYWRMNAARLNDDFYRLYFGLLAETQRVGTADVAAISDVLSRHTARDGLQFSFATKLAHMVEPRIPVYDSFVAAFYFYTPPPATKPTSERLSELVQFHRFLTSEYRRVLTEGLLAAAITHMRQSRSLEADIPDERVIDWLIWSWVSLLRARSQSEMTALFD